ncbi:MAG TPA: hypothetical protein VNT81_03655 [Vicinamibacterales bacterium]|nr:hypothetical protein [Vicinamibacterales bacterium]
MSPSEFTFKLTVPNDPEGATVAAVVAAHAVDYAQIEKAAGAAFVERVRGAVAQALKSAPGTHTPVVFGAAAGQLTVTFGSQSVSEPLPK